jgi:hypothetical protein
MSNDITELLPEDALIADGFDRCIIGVDSKGRAVYDQEKMIEVLIDRDGMTPEDAHEFFDFNIACADMGDMTPVYITLFRPNVPTG